MSAGRERALDSAETQIHAPIGTHIYMNFCTYMYMYARTYTYEHTHTRGHTLKANDEGERDKHRK